MRQQFHVYHTTGIAANGMPLFYGIMLCMGEQSSALFISRRKQSANKEDDANCPSCLKKNTADACIR
ncbi:hypothetical protein NE665_12695 [Clostridium sp. DFI.1.208]|uniref:hypothetical protein n=1 Tax=Clostridium innocuum TaxID=1522 RepID=UPI0011C0E131|nr:hypothetical protein [[Clostridium] innocuum]MCQ5278382.1 hypothetical protein [Clostridium sp. DFI.1.208]